MKHAEKSPVCRAGLNLAPSALPSYFGVTTLFNPKACDWEPARYRGYWGVPELFLG